VQWYEGMGHSFAQITPDANVPPAQRAATDLSQERSFEFFRRELGGDVPRAMAPMPLPDLIAPTAPLEVVKLPQAEAPAPEARRRPTPPPGKAIFPADR